MADDTSIRQKENEEGYQAGRGQYVQVPRREFAKIIHHVLASKNLYAYLQSVATENKKLKQRIQDLERSLLSTGQKLGKICITQSRIYTPGMMSLPASLSSDLNRGHFDLERLPRVQSSDNGDSSCEKCDPLKPDNDTSVSFEFDQDEGSPPRSPVHEECAEAERVSNVQEIHVLSPGVSQEYFNIVVKELAKSKQFIKQLLFDQGTKPEHILDIVYLKEMIQTLEQENNQLRNTNLNLRSLLVMEAVGTQQESSLYADRIINLHEKVQKLERQLGLKDRALEQLNKQCEIWKKYGQKTVVSRYRKGTQQKLSETDQVFEQEFQETGSQTDLLIAHLQSTFSQTDALSELGILELTSQSFCGSEQQRFLEKAKKKISELEMMVGDLVTKDLEKEEHNSLLREKNTMLQENYEQLLRSMQELERDHDVAQYKQRNAQLLQKLNEANETLKEKIEDIQYMRVEIQGLQSDLGKASTDNTRLEAILKQERERCGQQECQLLSRIVLLQNQFDKLAAERNALQKQTSPESNIAKVFPQIQQTMEHTSLPQMLCKPVRPMPWLQGPKEVSLQADGDEVHDSKLMEKHSLKKQPASFPVDQYTCNHCLRTDFTDENSFLNHMQKCGD